MIQALLVVFFLAVMAGNAYLRHIRRCPFCGHDNRYYSWEYRLCQGCKRRRP